MRVNRNYVLTEYVLNENDCSVRSTFRDELRNDGSHPLIGHVCFNTTSADSCFSFFFLFFFFLSGLCFVCFFFPIMFNRKISSLLFFFFFFFVQKEM